MAFGTFIVLRYRIESCPVLTTSLGRPLRAAKRVKGGWAAGFRSENVSSIAAPEQTPEKTD